MGRTGLSSRELNRVEVMGRVKAGNLRLREAAELLSSDWVVSYKTRLLQLERQSRHHAPAKSRVTVQENEQGEIAITYRGQRLAFTEIAQRPERPSGRAPLCPRLAGDTALLRQLILGEERTKQSRHQRSL